MTEKKLIIIDCTNSSSDEIINIQKFLFERGFRWNSGKEIKKSIPNSIIIEDNKMFEVSEPTIHALFNTDNHLIKYDSPVEYMRIYKINKLKNKFN